MKQPIKAVMLPTEDKSFLATPKSHNHVQLFHKEIIESDVLQPIHIYITVSQDVEPIKAPCWVLTKDNLKPFQVTDEEGEIKETFLESRKIIATTDPKLTIENDCISKGKSISPSGTNKWFKLLPQVQQSFLKEFVANPDGEWEVEYDSKVDIGYCANCNGGSDRSFQCTCESGQRVFGTKKILKLNQDNTVNITSVEKKMLPVSEVKELLELLAHELINGDLNHNRKDVMKWIKENL